MFKNNYNGHSLKLIYTVKINLLSILITILKCLHYTEETTLNKEISQLFQSIF